MSTMRPTDALNERQLEVLRWIANGCQDGIMAGHTHKTTARALQGRRLVKISKQGGVWTTTVTDTGIYYLEHGSFPPSTKPSTTPLARPTPRPDNKPKEGHGAGANTNHDERRHPRHPPQRRKLSPTEQLVADVVAADGVLELPEKSGNVADRMAELVRSANRYGKTPAGKRLVHHVVRDGGWAGPRRDLFVLEDGPMGTDAPLLPVPVHEEIRRYHPAVSTLRKSNRLGTTSNMQKRALRILQAVATEAEHRSFSGYAAEGWCW